MSMRDELHRLVDELPDDLAGQVLDFVQHLHSAQRPEARSWEPEVACALAERLDRLEAEDDPAAKRTWFDAFEAGARPCRYVPGEGFVAV